ncbi:ectoine synthase [Burkholderia sp. AU36459]|uniref:ectoine synthase n=1 Tax=Burkholderia sp. AU36459 TaxID=2879632 RepID=UPI0021F42928|nr:ectoine synthase [Burkholderia sp. AU36459]
MPQPSRSLLLHCGRRRGRGHERQRLSDPPGTIYVLDQHDQHYLRGGKDGDLVLVSVFNPPLKGHERHNPESAEASDY